MEKDAMVKEIREYFEFEDVPILEGNDADFSTTFCRDPEESSLEVVRFREDLEVQHDNNLSSYFCHEMIYFGEELNRLAVRLSYPSIFCYW
jgi:hypothetical protein